MKIDLWYKNYYMIILFYQNNMTKEFKKGYEYKETVFEPKLIPWINDTQINQDISIEL